MSSVALAEELLLLAYDDESGKATGSHIGLDLAMAAGMLVDLALAGRLAYAGGMIVVVNPAPTGEPIADEVLARVVADTPHTPASWLQRLRHGLRDRVLADLCGRGILRDVDETQLGFIHLHRYPTADPTVEDELRARLGRALTGDDVPDERTAALAALVAAARMEPALYLSGDEIAAAHQRLQEISDHAGFTGTVSMEESSIRPSVALVVSVLVKAIQTALGTARPVATPTPDAVN
ncbi:GPP34 family phosphoprotein [Dactylosporangium aurantiacum]|uniref:GPP34 family phosphoprotein n=1 Tax=Dactylosporangium aurantiacum TaxID=35754 RepID=A0A9Q9MJL7_9ACTN|nr:GPP34 family phosphoprotein [Dactylosporangium aurantiacum]MDG6107957.1 GPP34 family phosphoprotein [Dactylosporangium aurantiacum]UWZ59199.1 GPP34 family phosphoprotein [Dactylosporangium aurantiacum]